MIQKQEHCFSKRKFLNAILHVQFNPVNSEQIMYNHQVAKLFLRIRRIWLYDHEKDEIIRIRTEGADTSGNPRGYKKPKTGYAMRCGVMMEKQSFTTVVIAVAPNGGKI